MVFEFSFSESEGSMSDASAAIVSDTEGHGQVIDQRASLQSPGKYIIKNRLLVNNIPIYYNIFMDRAFIYLTKSL